jgi:hypothetical protein
MSAQSQEQQVDHGQVVDTAQHVDQAQDVTQTQDVNQDQAQTTNQVDNTAQAAIANNRLLNLLPAMLQIGAQQATAMFRAVTTRGNRASSNASDGSNESNGPTASNGSNGSNGPTTPFDNEIDEPVVVTPSMYEQESPVIQPQDQQQEEPHPLKKSERCRNIPLLRQLSEHPNIIKEDEDLAKEHLKDSDTLPGWMYDKYDLKVQYESVFEIESDFDSESESGSDSGSGYGDEGAIYFETNKPHGQWA